MDTELVATGAPARDFGLELGIVLAALAAANFLLWFLAKKRGRSFPAAQAFLSFQLLVGWLATTGFFEKRDFKESMNGTIFAQAFGFEIIIVIAVLSAANFLCWYFLGKKKGLPGVRPAQIALTVAVLLGYLWVKHAYFAQSLASVLSMLVVIVEAIFVLEALLWLVLGRLLGWKLALPAMLLAPAVIGLVLLIVIPMGYEFGLAFSNMSLASAKRASNPDFGLAQGFANFARVFTENILPGGETFFPVFLRTFAWTFIQVFFHVAIGLGLALLLNRRIKFRGFWRTLLIVPWAVPQVVAVLAWRGEFNYQLGFVNALLQNLGLQPVQWMADPTWNFVAMNVVNIWLGVPFMMVILLGGLQSIDRTYYEAAEMDGASGWRRFRHVTLPLIQPIMTPAVVLGIIWTFNNFNVPYFMNQNELPSSNILITALFRLAFSYWNTGLAAAFALVIFLILFGLSVLYMRMTEFKPVGRPAKAGEDEPARAALPAGEERFGPRHLLIALGAVLLLYSFVAPWIQVAFSGSASSYSGYAFSMAAGNGLGLVPYLPLLQVVLFLAFRLARKPGAMHAANAALCLLALAFIVYFAAATAGGGVFRDIEVANTASLFPAEELTRDKLAEIGAKFAVGGTAFQPGFYLACAGTLLAAAGSAIAAIKARGAVAKARGNA